MRTPILIALLSSIAVAFQASAREPISLPLSTGSVRLKIQDGTLLVSADGQRTVALTEEHKNVTNFAVTEWNDRQGVALVIELKGFGESRSYWWMTAQVGNGTSSSTGTDSDTVGVRVMGQGPIFENVEPLSILDLKSHGDGILVTLCDPSSIPDSDRKAAFRFQHDCAITSKPNLGRSRRHYLTPTAVKTIANETKQQLWKTDTSPSSN